MARIYVKPSSQPDEESGPVEVREPAPILGGSTEGEVVSAAPTRNASKVDWVDYAVTQGADRGETEELSRDELAELYG